MSSFMQNIATTPGFWTESRKQYAFAGVMILFGLAAFVEVVLMPGALFRRPVATAATNPANPQSVATVVSRQENPPKVGVVESLLESAEAKRLRVEAAEAAARRAVKNRLAETQAELTEAHATVAGQWQRFVEEAQRRCQVKIDAVPFDPRTQPRALNQVILSDRTAAVAWAAIRDLAGQADSQFKTIDKGISDLSTRLAHDSFVDSDGSRQQSLLAMVKDMRGRIQRG